MQRQPILLQTCAQASTVAESRFRIDAPDTHRRDSRILALDEDAAALVGRLAEHEWRGGHFLTYVEPGDQEGGNGIPRDATLRTPDGQSVHLSDELAGADVVVMIATASASAEAAAIVGDACAARKIMSAALVVADEHEDVDEAVAALRPNAMVLVILKDETDVTDMLTALRA